MYHDSDESQATTSLSSVGRIPVLSLSGRRDVIADLLEYGFTAVHSTRYVPIMTRVYRDIRAYNRKYRIDVDLTDRYAPTVTLRDMDTESDAVLPIGPTGLDMHEVGWYQAGEDLSALLQLIHTILVNNGLSMELRVQ